MLNLIVGFRNSALTVERAGWTRDYQNVLLAILAVLFVLGALFDDHP